MNFTTVSTTNGIASISPVQKFSVIGDYAGLPELAELVASYRKAGEFRLGMVAKKLAAIAVVRDLSVGDLLGALLNSGEIEFAGERGEISASINGGSALIQTIA